LVGDLTCAPHIAADSFDCVILTQTLHLIYEVGAAVRTIYRILKPGGVLLATIPGISQASRGKGHDHECWGFTLHSARQAFTEVFGEENVWVEARGNVLAAAAFLYGVAAQELQPEELNYRDPDYQILITVRAAKTQPGLLEQPAERHDTSLRNEATAGLQSNSRRIRQHTTPGALILLYHRVAEATTDPWALCVTPHHFAEHLEILQRSFRVCSLRELDLALANNNLPDRSVVVTFDDGYVDNLQTARPLLEVYDIPATVFLTTGLIGQECEFWWDELDRLLLQPGLLPNMLTLRIEGRTYGWEMGDGANYDENAFQRYRGWKAWEAAPCVRQMLYRSLYELLRPVSQDERCDVLTELRSWVGTAAAGRPSHRILSPAELVTLANGDLLDIGAHTVTHPVLSGLPTAAQWDEIRRSKDRLEEIIGRPVRSFAYPHGMPSDYTSETIAMVREAGFASGCAAYGGVVEAASDRFQLPRIEVQDCDGEKFARHLAKWLAVR
ncbi:MAG: polysaccharide deacetylase family protein, partial [Candidatus Entotheonellia bacterium]